MKKTIFRAERIAFFVALIALGSCDNSSKMKHYNDSVALSKFFDSLKQAVLAPVQHQKDSLQQKCDKLLTADDSSYLALEKISVETNRLSHEADSVLNLHKNDKNYPALLKQKQKIDAEKTKLDAQLLALLAKRKR